MFGIFIATNLVFFLRGRAGLEGNVKNLFRKAREDACMDVSKK